MGELAGKPTSAARVTLSQIMDSHDTNLLGTVHGGVIMKLVDSVAGVVAARHSGGSAVTAALDEMTFLVPVRVGDVVHVSSQVNWAGKSSMEIGVQVKADRWDESVPAVHVASAYLAFVAIDADGKPPGALGHSGDRRRPAAVPRGRDPSRAPPRQAQGHPGLAGRRLLVVGSFADRERRAARACEGGPPRSVSRRFRPSDGRAEPCLSGRRRNHDVTGR